MEYAKDLELDMRERITMFKNRRMNFGMGQISPDFVFYGAQTEEEKENSLENLHNLVECARKEGEKTNKNNNGKKEKNEKKKNSQTKHYLITELVEKKIGIEQNSEDNGGET